MVRIRSDKFKVSTVAAQLENRRTTRSDGRVSFRGWGFDEDLLVLLSSLEFSGDIPEAERFAMIQRGIFSAGRHEITEARLLRAIRDEESKLLATKAQRYILATTISIPRSFKVPAVTIGRARVSFSPRLPKRFSLEPLKDRFEIHRAVPEPANYQSVRVSIDARTHTEAFAQGISVLDFMRSVWNFRLNRSTSFRRSFILPVPVNKVVLGPVRTVHLPVGTLAWNGFWLDRQFEYTPPLPLGLDKRWAALKAERRAWSRSLARSNYHLAIVGAMIRYCRALDTTNWESAFTGLWGVLEYLTNTVGGGYDQTIRRCLFLLEPRNYHQQVLEHLKSVRNRIVHFAEETEYGEALVYQLKRYVEVLLLFHRDWSNRFGSIGDAAEFLDLPTERFVLKNRRKLLDTAIRIRRGDRG